MFAVAHRCACGLPDVIQTAPRLPDGTPFPTLYYLTCPRAAAAVSRLEAAGVMREMTRRLAGDAGLLRQQQAAHEDYLRRRDDAALAAGSEPLPAGTPSAGGMPGRVKCLHALAAHELACPGANALGGEVIRAAGNWWAACASRRSQRRSEPERQRIRRGARSSGGAPGGTWPGGGVPGGARTAIRLAATRLPGRRARRRPMTIDGEARGGPARGGPVTRPPDGAVRVAAIDCGTNSLRLLIADIDPVKAVLADHVRRMEIVRLGQGVDASGCLSADALARTFGVLEEYARILSDASPGAVRMVATSATRDAANSAEFVRGVIRILGVPPGVLSGDEEASLSYLGATAELARLAPGRPAGEPLAGDPLAGDPLAPPYLVVDIGGGSTEFVLGGAAAESGPAPVLAARTALAAVSVDIGCVRMTERHLRADPPTDAEIAAATADIDAAIAAAAAQVPARRARTLVGLAGSVTTVAGIALGLPGYDASRIHHARIPAATVHAVTRMLLSQTRAERAQIGVMHPGRVDVIGAGALVLDRILARLGFAEVVVSEHDILDGIAWSLVGTRAG